MMSSVVKRLVAAERAAWTRSLRDLVLIVPALALGTPATMRAQMPPEGFAPCASARGDAWCGSMVVPEDHDDPTSRRIGLNVKILSATDEPRGAVFFLAGGPGQAATDLESAIVARFGARLRDRDLVLVDQRGTGDSNPLTCPSDAPEDPTRLFGPHYTDEEIGACLEELRSRADLLRYTTTDFARDLETVRHRLGYDRVDLVGGSYGTKAAQVYMRLHPSRVRTVVLEGVASTSFLNPLPAARGSQIALDRLFDDCEADPGCAGAYPDLRRRFGALLERLAEDPPNVTVPGTSTEVALEREALAFLTHLLLFSPHGSAGLPALLDATDRGEYGPVVGVASQILGHLVGGIDYGLQLAVTCAENVPWFSERDVEAATRGTYLGSSLVDGIVKSCSGWPVGPVPPGFHDPVTVDVPTLLVSGALDPATPASFADEVASTLPDVRHVVVENGAHVTAHPCVDGLVARFIESGGEDPLDTGCLEDIRRPPFQLPGR